MKKNYMTRMAASALVMLCSLSAMAQLNGTGYYRFRNAQYMDDYISLANDKFNYHTVIAAGGNLSGVATSEGQAKALACAAKFLQTDIHMVQDAECIDPGSVIYADKKNNNSSNHDYNLIGQGTSLLTLTTGRYDGTFDLDFNNRYITIDPVSNTSNPTLYTAKVELKSATSVFLYGQPSLGIRYFVDDNGKFAISESTSSLNAKWYIEPLDHFNVQPEVEYKGKYYTTLYVPYAFQLSGQVVNAYVVTAINADGTLELEKVATNGDTVPAGTPVILECSSNTATDCQLIPTEIPLFTEPVQSVTTQGAPAATTSTNYSGTNLLKGTYFNNTDGLISGANNFTAPTNPQKYVIGITASRKLGFVKATGTAMPANKAWLEYTGAAELVLPFENVKLGDVNKDGDVTIADVTALVNILRGGDTSQYDQKAADVNEKGGVDVDDINALVDMILKHE